MLERVEIWLDTSSRLDRHRSMTASGTLLVPTAQPQWGCVDTYIELTLDLSAQMVVQPPPEAAE